MLRIQQDFLILELTLKELKYIYSSFDKNRAETLDRGTYPLPSGDWRHLIVDFKEALKQIAATRLPPYDQLEVFLIPPPETVLISQLVYPASCADAFADWRDWELSLLMPEEREGYLGEFGPPIAARQAGFNICSCAAIRSRQVTQLSQILKEKRLSLQGIFLPNLLWKEALARLFPHGNGMNLICRHTSGYSLWQYQADHFPRYRSFYAAQSATASVQADCLRNLAEELACLAVSVNNPMGLPACCLIGDLEQDELATVEEIARTQVREISPAALLDGMESACESDFLLLHIAQMQASRLYLSR